MTRLGEIVDPGDLYRSSRPYLNLALDYYRDEVGRLLAGRISDQYITGRVKSARSLIRKLREKPNEPRTWDSVRDKVGVRIICSTMADCWRIDEIIQQSQWVILDRKIKDGEPNELFYPGIHLIVESPAILDHLGIPIPCEIQVRTRAQDAWSVVSHRLTYKEDVKPPKKLRRMIERLTVVVELFDEEVQRVFDQRRELEMFRTRIVLECLDLQYETLTGDISEGFPDFGILDLILRAYSSEELFGFERLMEQFCDGNSVHISELIQSHRPESLTYVDSKDWLFSQPEILPVLERASHKPYLLLDAIKDTDLEDVVRRSCISAGMPLP